MGVAVGVGVGVPSAGAQPPRASAHAASRRCRTPAARPKLVPEGEFTGEPRELPQLEKQPAREAFCPEHNSQGQG